MQIPEQIDRYLPLLQGILVGVVTLIAGWIISKWANRVTLAVIHRRKVDEALARFLAAIAQYVVLALAVIAALESVGIKTTSLVALLASAGLAIGLALQGSLGNFASGVLILFFRPFQLGDLVTVAGQTGFVKDIGIFATTLVPPDNSKIIIGNSSITGGVIINYTTLGTRRAEIDFAVAAAGADVQRVTEALLRAAKRAEHVLSDPAPAVALISVGKGALEFKLLVWSKSEKYLDVLHNVKVAAFQELGAAGIKGAMPQLAIHQTAA